MRRTFGITITLAALIAVFFLANIAPTEVFANAEHVNAKVRAASTIPVSMLNYDGNDIGLEAVIEYNGKQYPAFCIDPVLPGAAGHPNKEYPVTIAGTNMLPKV